MEKENRIIKEKKNKIIGEKENDIANEIAEEKQDDVFLPQECIKTEDLSENICKVTVSPLEVGFGITIGNALRRVLLGYIHGYAIYSIYIKGVKSEFDCIDGVRQDVLTIVLNLKKIILKKKKNIVSETEDASTDKEVICVKKKNGVFTGKDISLASKFFDVVNEDLEICDFSQDVDFEIKISVNSGVGYKPAKEFDNNVDKIGTIYMDRIYSPIYNVSYNVVDNFHLENKNRCYDSLILKIETNGAISAKEALNEASKILLKHFKILLKEDNYKNDSNEEDFVENMKKDAEHRKELLSTPVLNLKFSTRAHNCFIKAGIKTVADLLKYTDEELRMMKNFGRVTADEVRAFKIEKGFCCFDANNLEEEEW